MRSEWIGTSAIIAALATSVLAGGDEGQKISLDGLVGTDVWAGRPRHLAVVNPAVKADDGSVISLRGEWEFAPWKHQGAARDAGCSNPAVDFWGNPSCWAKVRKISVPGCWEAQGVGEEGLARSYNGRPDKDSGLLRLRHTHFGNGFYRRTVDIPASWKGRRIWLKVGRVGTWGWFWINDRAVAHTAESHRALKWEVTDLVTPGTSCVIKAEVDNLYPTRNTQCFTYNRWGGLLRDVELEATAETFIDEAWVRGDFDKHLAEVHVEIAGKREGGGGNRDEMRLRATVEGETKEIALRSTASTPSTYTLELPLGDFRPWSPEHPNLYTAKVELVRDGKAEGVRYERFGVRKFEVRDKELYLNGKPFLVRGFGDDSTYPLDGFSPASKEFHLRHLGMARRAGFNYVRTHTHCEIPEYFDAADEVGILVQPELSYANDISSEEYFGYDVLGDAKALWEGYRRHPSFATYSGGNEGTLGPFGGVALRTWVHANDPDRLVIEQDGGTFMQPRRAETYDFVTGPYKMWERGTFDWRPFVCHEYANLAVKGDARMEDDFTGPILPRITRADRRAALAPAGLSEAWGDLLQDAQHDLQRFWARRSIESARKDPLCSGFIYWTIVDFMHWEPKVKAPMAQGMFDPFWRPKPHGTTPESIAEVNSPSVLLLDTENRVRKPRRAPIEFFYREESLAIDETNRVYCSGETIPAEFIFQHYGERDLEDTCLDWALADADGRRLAGAEVAVGAQRIGAARTVAKVLVVVPDVAKACKATLSATLVDAKGFRQTNAWTFWLFPKPPKDTGIPENVIVADYGSVEAETARRAGRNLVLVGNRKGRRDIRLGWWSVTWRNSALTQNGVAVRQHPLFREFPYEPFLSPLLFNIIGQGTPLPVEGFVEKDFIMVGEGNTDFKLYLAAKVRPDGGREVFVSGLDVFSDRPESKFLLKDLCSFARASVQ